MDFGKMDAAAKEYGAGGNQGGGFLKLEVGDNKVRIVSDFEVLAKYWANGKMLGIARTGFPAPMTTDKKTGEEVPLKPQVKFLMHVIDRKDGEFKIAELGWSILNAIKELQEDDEYAFDGLPPYDINIKKTVENGGKNPSDTSYTVIAARTNTELTAEEQEKLATLMPIKDIVQKIKDKANGEGGDTREDDGAPLPDDETEEVTLADM